MNVTLGEKEYFRTVLRSFAARHRQPAKLDPNRFRAQLVRRGAVTCADPELALEFLGGRQAECLRRRLAGQTTPEIADELGVRPNVVVKAVGKAVQAINRIGDQLENPEFCDQANRDLKIYQFVFEAFPGRIIPHLLEARPNGAAELGLSAEAYKHLLYAHQMKLSAYVEIVRQMGEELIGGPERLPLFDLWWQDVRVQFKKLAGVLEGEQREQLLAYLDRSALAPRKINDEVADPGLRAQMTSLIDSVPFPDAAKRDVFHQGLLAETDLVIESRNRTQTLKLEDFIAVDSAELLFAHSYQVQVGGDCFLGWVGPGITMQLCGFRGQRLLHTITRQEKLEDGRTGKVMYVWNKLEDFGLPEKSLARFLVGVRPKGAHYPCKPIRPVNLTKQETRFSRFLLADQWNRVLREYWPISEEVEVEGEKQVVAARRAGRGKVRIGFTKRDNIGSRVMAETRELYNRAKITVIYRVNRNGEKTGPAIDACFSAVKIGGRQGKWTICWIDPYDPYPLVDLVRDKKITRPAIRRFASHPYMIENYPKVVTFLTSFFRREQSDPE